jgi:hypothetical protein
MQLLVYQHRPARPPTFPSIAPSVANGSAQSRRADEPSYFLGHDGSFAQKLFSARDGIFPGAMSVR